MMERNSDAYDEQLVTPVQESKDMPMFSHYAKSMHHFNIASAFDSDESETNVTGTYYR